MDISLAKNLYLWARGKPENRAQLEAWQTAAIAELAAGKGATVANTSANGVSVAFSSSGLTVSEWFNVVSTALRFLDTPPVSKIKGVIRG